MKMELHDFRTGISDNSMSGQPEFSHKKKIARGLLDVVAFFVLFCFSCYFHFRDSCGRSDCYSRTMWLLCVSVFFMWDMKVVPPLLPFPGALLQSDRRIFFPAPSPELSLMIKDQCWLPPVLLENNPILPYIFGCTTLASNIKLHLLMKTLLLTIFPSWKWNHIKTVLHWLS